MFSADMIEAALVTGLKFAALVVTLPIVFGCSGVVISGLFPHWLDFAAKGKGLRMDSLSKGEPKTEPFDPRLTPSILGVADEVIFKMFILFVVVGGYYATGDIRLVVAHVALILFQKQHFMILDFLGIGPFAYYKQHKGEIRTDWTGLPRLYLLGGAMGYLRGADMKSSITKHLQKLAETGSLKTEFSKMRKMKAGDVIPHLADKFKFTRLQSFWQAAFCVQMLCLALPFPAIVTKLGITVAETFFGTKFAVEVVTEIALMSAQEGIFTLFDIANISENREFFTSTSGLAMTAFSGGILYDSRKTSMFGNRMTHCPARHFVTDLWKSQPKFQKKEGKASKCPFAAAFSTASKCPFSSRSA